MAAPPPKAAARPAFDVLSALPTAYNLLPFTASVLVLLTTPAPTF